MENQFYNRINMIQMCMIIILICIGNNGCSDSNPVSNSFDTKSGYESLVKSKENVIPGVGGLENVEQSEDEKNNSTPRSNKKVKGLESLQGQLDECNLRANRELDECNLRANRELLGDGGGKKGAGPKYQAIRQECRRIEEQMRWRAEEE